MKKYLVVIETQNGDIVKAIDVTGLSERSIDRIDGGLNINLNHEKYHTNVIESATELNISKTK